MTSIRRATQPGSKKHSRKADGLAVRLVLLAAASYGGAAGAFVTPGFSAGKTTTTLFHPVATTAKSDWSQGLLSPRMSVDTPGNKDGHRALAVAVVGEGGGVSAAAPAAKPQTLGIQTTVDAGTTAAVDVPVGGGVLDPVGPGAAAEEAKLTMAKAVRVKKAKTVARALPGTWWAGGLPKWMHTVRRRMTTKEDYLHLHAASGGVSTTRRYDVRSILQKRSRTSRFVVRSIIFFFRMTFPVAL